MENILRAERDGIIKKIPRQARRQRRRRRGDHGIRLETARARRRRKRNDGPPVCKRYAFFFRRPGGSRRRLFYSAPSQCMLAGAASHLLTMPAVMSRGGPWLFAAAQALLIWIWYVLHAKRLHDADRSVAPAVAASILYGLAIILLLILAVSFYSPLAGQGTDANTASALGLILLVAVVAVLLGSPHYDLAWLVVAILLAARFPAVDPRGWRHCIRGDQTKRGRPCGVILYFAYGSNMHRDVMATHAPNAVPVGVRGCGELSLRDHRRRLCICRAEASASTVYGVLWRIDPARPRDGSMRGRTSPAGLYRAKTVAGSTRRPPLQRAHLYCAATAGRTGEGWLYGACDRGGAGVAIAAGVHCIFAALFAEALGRGDLAQS